MDSELREAILERDNYECQLDKLFGISELTGIPCSEDLEVHHKRYPERGEDDLITMCFRCHELLTDGIRRTRYEGNQLEPDDVQTIMKRRKLESVIRDYTVPDHRGITPDNAQWPTG